jgi:membrane associated rhomboid family serine protease
MQLLSGLAVLSMDANGGVAFWAHVGGFVAGMLLIPFFKKRSIRLFR